MATETQAPSLMPQEKAKAFFASEVFRCSDEDQLNLILKKYEDYKFNSRYIISILRDAGSANLSPSGRAHFDKKINSMLLNSNRIEVAKPTHVLRTSRQR